ncbi:MAG: hypothetical protein KAW14_11220, partial [Candidatus Aegiribacteria sp.]|nr:hypothetical protein [Candidatus Aegiribacteria sp.]
NHSMSTEKQQISWSPASGRTTPEAGSGRFQPTSISDTSSHHPDISALFSHDHSDIMLSMLINHGNVSLSEEWGRKSGAGPNI